MVFRGFLEKLVILRGLKNVVFLEICGLDRDWVELGAFFGFYKIYYF